VFTLRKFDAEQMFILVRMQLRNHADAQPKKRFKQPCRRTTTVAFQATMQTHNHCSVPSVARTMRHIYMICNLECFKCPRMRFHCANGLMVPTINDQELAFKRLERNSNLWILSDNQT